MLKVFVLLGAIWLALGSTTPVLHHNSTPGTEEVDTDGDVFSEWELSSPAPAPSSPARRPQPLPEDIPPETTKVTTERLPSEPETSTPFVTSPFEVEFVPEASTVARPITLNTVMETSGPSVSRSEEESAVPPTQTPAIRRPVPANFPVKSEPESLTEIPVNDFSSEISTGRPPLVTFLPPRRAMIPVFTPIRTRFSPTRHSFIPTSSSLKTFTPSEPTTTSSTTEASTTTDRRSFSSSTKKATSENVNSGNKLFSALRRRTRIRDRPVIGVSQPVSQSVSQPSFSPRAARHLAASSSRSRANKVPRRIDPEDIYPGGPYKPAVIYKQVGAPIVNGKPQRLPMRRRAPGAKKVPIEELLGLVPDKPVRSPSTSPTIRSVGGVMPPRNLPRSKPRRNNVLQQGIEVAIPSEIKSQFAVLNPKEGTYRFGYDTGTFGEQSYRYERRDPDGRVTGKYGYIDPEGVLREVNYVADENGYRPFLINRYRVDAEPPHFVGPIPGQLKFT